MKKETKEPLPGVKPETLKRIITKISKFVDIPERDFSMQLSSYLKPQPYNKTLKVLEEGKISKHIYFVDTGIMYASYNHPKKLMIIYEIYKPGRVVMISNSFINKVSTDCELTVCKNSEVVSLSYEDLQKLCLSFPTIKDLGNKLLAAGSTRVKERDFLFQKPGMERVKYFFDLYPELLSKPHYAPIPHVHLCTYLHLTEYTFCKYFKKLYPNL